MTLVLTYKYAHFFNVYPFFGFFVLYPTCNVIHTRLGDSSSSASPFKKVQRTGELDIVTIIQS